MQYLKLPLKLSLIALPLLIAAVFLAPAKPAHAAYDGANVIDNSVFLNSNAMSLSAIQNHLASKGSALASRNFVLNCYGADSQERQWYRSVGAPCDQNVPAAQIIYYTAKVYGINPQVILATMQKEQSLITAPNPTARQVAQAMGYGCPTTGNCDDSSNFFWQVDNGTWVLRYHYERANRNFNWWKPSTSWTCGTEKNFYKPNLYPGQNVRFYDGAGVNYRTYFIANAATSSLYCYTPHAYNNPQGLYGRAPFGTVGQYYSGSYNFVYFFEAWFGSTRGIPIPGCDEATNTSYSCVWKLRHQSGKQMLLTSVAERNALLAEGYSYEGKAFFGNNSVAPMPDNIPVYRLVAPNGSNLLTTDSNERNVLKNAGFTDKGIDFYADPPASNSGYPVYRLYSASLGAHAFTASTAERTQMLASGYTNEGVAFAAVSPIKRERAAPAGKLLVYRFSSMPGNSHFWTTDINERDTMIRARYRYEGVAWQSSATATAKPIYRLYSPGMQKHLYTTDTNERNTLSQTGSWRYEGISQYMSPTPTASPVYRLYSPITNNHFWTTDAYERDTLVRVGTFRSEGVGWYQP